MAATDLRLCRGGGRAAEYQEGPSPDPHLRNVVCLQEKLGPVCISSIPTQAQADAQQIRKPEQGKDPEEFSSRAESPKPAQATAFFIS